ncbi:hypothetical protein FKM82_014526 [Ascaphus truei]
MKAGPCFNHIKWARSGLVHMCRREMPVCAVSPPRGERTAVRQRRWKERSKHVTAERSRTQKKSTLV